jgi:pimeloyl-ACP methyl ester carboxylesterase
VSETRQGWATVWGKRAHYTEAGAGPTVLVAPGLGLSTRFYGPVLTSFARAGVRLIVPHLPGFGRTKGPVTGMAVPDVARWLLELADALQLQCPGWLGHSVGCQVALEIAATRPERAAALALAAPTGVPARFRLARQLLALPLAAAREPARVLWAVLRDYVRFLPSAYLGSWIRAGADQPVGKLDRIRCPTLLLVGGRDPIVPWRDVARLRDGIAGSRVTVIRRGNHALPLDAMDVFTPAAADFFRGVVPFD